MSCALTLGACDDKGPAAPAAADTAATKPAGAIAGVPVSTTPALKRTLTLTLEATGSATPVSVVDVRPQLGGVISRVHVKEGQNVRAGELLFTLDTRADAANVAKMRAQITKDEALLADAQRQLARSRDLLAKNFITQGAVDTNQAAVDSQLANLKADQAAVAAALVPLSYGQVRAASAGRIGLVPVFAGSAVQANLTTLTTLTQLDPIDVAFNLPQSALPELLTRLKSGRAAVEARLPDNPKPLVGRLSFVDSLVDANSGTVKVKARFDNRDQQLWPGVFAKVSLQTGRLEDAIVVPLQAVIQGPRGTIAYVARDGKAAMRPVKLLAAQGNDAAVSGIEAGDQVIVEGRQNLRPDAPIAERAPEGGAKAGQASPDKAAKQAGKPDQATP